MTAEEMRPSATVAGEGTARTADRTGEGMLRAAGDAIAAEGTAAEERSAEQRPPVIAWLFQPSAEPRRVDPSALSDLITIDENLVWVDLSGLTPSNLRQAFALVGAHRRAVEAAISSWQRPRVDILGDHFFVSATAASLDPAEHRVVARQLDLVVGPNYLLSAHKQPLPFYRQLLTRTAHDPDLVRLDSGFMLYIVLDELLAHYEELEREMRSEIEQLQAQALRDSSESFLEELLHFKRYTFALGQLAEQHRPVFQAFLRPDFRFLSSEEIQGHYGDLEVRLLRLIDRLELTRQEVNNTFDIYLSHQSHRTNSVMKTLTMVATLLFSATFIEGIFGPSFQGIPTHTVHGFIAMLALIGLVSAVALYAFHRRGWM